MDILKRWWEQHPNIVSWAVLSVGMVVILVWSARHVGFTPSQWVALIAATVVLAGLSVWIISWGEDEADEDDNQA